MAIADPAGRDRDIGEGKARGGGGRAEGAGVLDLFDEGDRGGAGGKQAVDPQVVRSLGTRALAGEKLGEPVHRGPQLGAGQAERPAAILWPPPFRISPSAASRWIAAPEVNAGDRPGRALALVALEPDDDRGAVRGLFQTRGDDADDARMPALGGGPDEGAVQAPRLGLGHGFFADPFGDLAAVGVELVEPGGDAGGLDISLSVARRRAPRSAWPMRPPALTRGPRRKPRE